MKLPTVEEKKIFKEFKSKVDLEAINALALGGRYRVMIDNMDCIFYPNNQQAIDKAMRNFKTTVWWKK